jgi:hypothetical protein
LYPLGSKGEVRMAVKKRSASEAMNAGGLRILLLISLGLGYLVGKRSIAAKVARGR